MNKQKTTESKSKQSLDNIWRQSNRLDIPEFTRYSDIAM